MEYVTVIALQQDPNLKPNLVSGAMVSGLSALHEEREQLLSIFYMFYIIWYYIY